MAGTVEGGKKAALTNRKRYGKEFYARIGHIGGQGGNTGGFASLKVGKDGLTGPQRARIKGAIGGAKSRRGKQVSMKQNQKKTMAATKSSRQRRARVKQPAV